MEILYFILFAVAIILLRFLIIVIFIKAKESNVPEESPKPENPLIEDIDEERANPFSYNEDLTEEEIDDKLLDMFGHEKEIKDEDYITHQDLMDDKIDSFNEENKMKLKGFPVFRGEEIKMSDTGEKIKAPEVFISKCCDASIYKKGRIQRCNACGKFCGKKKVDNGDQQ